MNSISSARIIASRVLHYHDRTGEVSLYEPVQKAHLWTTKVVIKLESAQAYEAKGTDSFDCLLNAFTLIRQELNELEKCPARFLDGDEPWHWFPMIPPSINKRFDSAIEDIIEKEHKRLCHSDRPSLTEGLHRRSKKGPDTEDRNHQMGRGVE